MKDNSIRIKWNNLIYFYLYLCHSVIPVCVFANVYIEFGFEVLLPVPNYRKELFIVDNITGLYIKVYP